MSPSTLETQGRLVESARGEPSFRAGSQARAKEGPRSARSPSDGLDPTASPAPMKTLLNTLAATLTLVGAGAGHAHELFVSPDGNDAHSGSRFHPLATLEIARDRLRSESLSRPGVRHTVIVRAGDHVRTQTLDLDARDSGLTFRGESGARILGARRLTGWIPSRDPRLPETARGQVHEVSLAGLPEAMKPLQRRGFGVAPAPAPPELFVSGRPQTLARWPNGDSWSRLASAADGRFVVSVDAARLARWATAAEPWVHGYWTYDWADSHERVRAIDPASQTLVTEAPHGVYGYKTGQRFYALNLVEELDARGEYWIDRKAAKLLAWLPDSGETLVSTLETPLVQVRGASDVRIERLAFAASRGDGIRVEGGERVTIAGCTFRGLGQSGIVIEGGREHRVVGCDLFDLGESGVMVSGGDRKTLEPAGHTVENCDIHHHGRLCRTYRPAIGIQGVGNRALHNRLHDAPHNAILMGGNDHVVEFNEIFRVCTQTGDAGAVYMGRDLTMRGTVLRHNHFHDIGPTLQSKEGFVDVMAIYLDDCFCGTEIVGNVFERAGRAAMIGGGRDNTLRGNLFIDCHPAIHVDARGTGWANFWFNGKDPFLMQGLQAVPYDRPPYATRYPHLATVLEDEPAKAKYNRIEHNVIVGRGKPIDWLDGLNETTVTVTGNTVVTEGAAVGLDPRRRTVRVAGFPPIPFSKIGLRPDVHRKGLR